MTQDKKKYLTKTVSFGGSKMTLYSVDGNTWSSRLDELDLLQERFENGGRLPVDATKGKQPFVIRKNKFAKRAADDEPPSLDDYDDAAVAIEDETLAGVVLDEELEEESLDEEVPAIKALGKAAKTGGDGATAARGKSAKEDKSSKIGLKVKDGVGKTSLKAKTVAQKTSAKISPTKSQGPGLDKWAAKGSLNKDSTKEKATAKSASKAPARTADKVGKSPGKTTSAKSAEKPKGHKKDSSKSSAKSPAKDKNAKKR